MKPSGRSCTTHNIPSPIWQKLPKHINKQLQIATNSKQILTNGNTSANNHTQQQLHINVYHQIAKIATHGFNKQQIQQLRTSTNSNKSQQLHIAANSNTQQQIAKQINKQQQLHTSTNIATQQHIGTTSNKKRQLTTTTQIN